ncbi:Transcriptional regulatory protein, partial [Quaeritorhiza haematococci]
MEPLSSPMRFESPMYDKSSTDSESGDEDPEEGMIGSNHSPPDSALSTPTKKKAARMNGKPQLKRVATPTSSVEDDDEHDDDADESQDENGDEGNRRGRLENQTEELTAEEFADDDRRSPSLSRHGKDRYNEAGDGNDTVEHEKMRQEALKVLTEIEVEFAKFRDKLYHEKMAELERETEAVTNGTHPELVAQMEEIEQKKEERLRIATQQRELQERALNLQFQAVVAQATSDFVCKRSELRRSLIASVESQRWKMTAEKRRLDHPDFVPLTPSLADRSFLVKRRKIAKSDMVDYKAIIREGMFPADILPMTIWNSS